MPSISELLIAKGESEAGVRRRRGELAGALVTSLGQIPAAIVADRQAQKAAEVRARVEAQREARAQATAEQEAAKATREQTTFDDARAGDEQGRQAVLGWLEKHGGKLEEGQADLIVAAIQRPGGVAKAIEVLSQAPKGMELFEHDTEKDAIDKRTGAVVIPAVPKVEAPKAVTYSAPQPVMVNGRRTLVRAGSDGQLYDTNNQKVTGASPDVPPTAADRDGEPLVAVMKDGRPVLVRRSQAEGMTPATTREQGRQVTAGDTEDIANLDSSLDDLNTLGKDMGVTGAEPWMLSKIPDVITSWTGWGADAKSRQGTIDRVKQVIGKALEGGVLRKEDEIKYEKILPKLGDAPSVAASKLQGLWQAIEKKKSTRLDALADAGYDTSRFLSRAPREQTFGGGTAPPPAPVAALLKAEPPGRYTLGDGSVWIKNADGSVTKGQ